MQTILANKTISVTELKRNFAEVLRQADDEPVAVLNHNRPEAYLLPAEVFERLINQLEDLEDAEIVRKRESGPFIQVSLDDL